MLDVMTSERSQAYGRVMKTLDDVGPAKLHESEREEIRAAADTLFFAEDLGVDAEARDAVSRITKLARTLVESERWLDDSARALLTDVMACGPLQPVA
jgi:3-oxoacyl-ACP reductase-like protein